MWYTKSMKTVLITGASGDIGREIVKNFAANGYYVLAIYNHVKVAPLKGIEFFKCNLADSDEIDEVIPQIIEKYEHIDCLVRRCSIQTNSRCYRRRFWFCYKQQFKKRSACN